MDNPGFYGAAEEDFDTYLWNYPNSLHFPTSDFDTTNMDMSMTINPQDLYATDMPASSMSNNEDVTMPDSLNSIGFLPSGHLPQLHQPVPANPATSPDADGESDATAPLPNTTSSFTAPTADMTGPNSPPPGRIPPGVATPPLPAGNDQGEIIVALQQQLKEQAAKLAIAESEIRDMYHHYQKLAATMAETKGELVEIKAKMEEKMDRMADILGRGLQELKQQGA